jgi:hypothetical protein
MPVNLTKTITITHIDQFSLPSDGVADSTKFDFDIPEIIMSIFESRNDGKTLFTFLRALNETIGVDGDGIIRELQEDGVINEAGIHVAVP